MATYWIQVSEDFDPVSVDLTDAEVTGVRKLLEVLADAGELIDLSDSTGTTIYDNYNEWRNSKINSSTRISASYPDSYFSQYREAKDFLDAQDPDKVALIEDCRHDIFEAYSSYNEPSEEDSFSKIESDVIREYRSIATEQWEDLTMAEVDEVFDKIFDALCIIHADDAAAWW